MHQKISKYPSAPAIRAVYAKSASAHSRYLSRSEAGERGLVKGGLYENERAGQRQISDFKFQISDSEHNISVLILNFRFQISDLKFTTSGL
jgi:hypothetical protein